MVWHSLKCRCKVSHDKTQTFCNMYLYVVFPYISACQSVQKFGYLFINTLNDSDRAPALKKKSIFGEH